MFRPTARHRPALPACLGPALFALALLAAPPLAARDGGGAANHLAGADSPYLLQHLHNPVDWYPWGEEALARARTENKPIFVSVGYSACHWCHVMREESFENAEIAALLNAHFISVKIDRESRPDLDERFMFATQVLAGSGGWPNSVFLTPGGDPFYAGGYFPPEIFAQLVTQLGAAWEEDAQPLVAHGALVAREVSKFLTQTSEAREVTPELVARAVEGLLGEMDPFHGGYGVAPKFPRESLFLFLLDHAERRGDAPALAAVTALLDGMIAGGIHDHVGGGFHRYAIDPEWHVPHFEKMLYTQAMTGRLLLRAARLTGSADYARAAERTFDYVLREMRGPGGAFHAAQDADSLTAGGESEEGAFYTWSVEDLAALGDAAEFARTVFQVTPDGDLEAGLPVVNVLNLAAPPAVLAGERDMTEAAFLARLDALLARMAETRARRPAPFLDRKIVLSWNGMMIATLAEAADQLDRPDYYAAAREAARFILDNMADDDGLKRIWFEGAAGVAAQLPDHAAFGLGLVALHDHAPDAASARGWLDAARRLALDLPTRFGTDDAGYRMVEDDGDMPAFIQIDDGEIPSGNALALALLTRLSHRMQDAAIGQEAYRLAAALSGHATDIPAQRGYALKAIEELQSGETGPLRFAAQGAVRAKLVPRAAGAARIEITVAEGWHINAREPLDDYFIPTGLAVEGLDAAAVRYPEPLTKTLDFSDRPLALYEGRVGLDIPGGAEGRAGPRRAVLTLQACSDEICLQPEELAFSW